MGQTLGPSTVLDQFGVADERHGGRCLSHFEDGGEHEEHGDAEHQQRGLDMRVRGHVGAFMAAHDRSWAVGTRQTMYQMPMMPATTMEIRTAMLSSRSPTLIEIATTIMVTAEILARRGMPAPER